MTKSKKRGYKGEKAARKRARVVIDAASKLVGPVRPGGYYQRSGVSSKPELKFHDFAFVSHAISEDANASLSSRILNLVPLGTTISQRIGQKFTIKSFSITGWIVGGATVTAFDLVRWAIVEDMFPQGAIATLAQMFVPNTGTTQYVSAIPNIENAGRFRVHKTGYVRLNSQAGLSASYSGAAAPIKIYKRCNIPVVMDNDPTLTPSISNVRQGALYLVISGTYNTATFNKALNARCRIRYVDA